jgi:N-formylglutamate amidohydrolase
MELWRLSHLHCGLHKRLRKLSEVNQKHGREVIINASSISSYSVNRCLINTVPAEVIGRPN